MAHARSWQPPGASKFLAPGGLLLFQKKIRRHNALRASGLASLRQNDRQADAAGQYQFALVTVLRLQAFVRYGLPFRRGREHGKRLP